MKKVSFICSLGILLACYGAQALSWNFAKVMSMALSKPDVFVIRCQSPLNENQIVGVIVPKEISKSVGVGIASEPGSILNLWEKSIDGDSITFSSSKFLPKVILLTEQNNSKLLSVKIDLGRHGVMECESQFHDDEIRGFKEAVEDDRIGYSLSDQSRQKKYESIPFLK